MGTQSVLGKYRESFVMTSVEETQDQSSDGESKQEYTELFITWDSVP